MDCISSYCISNADVTLRLIIDIIIGFSISPNIFINFIIFFDEIVRVSNSLYSSITSITYCVIIMVTSGGGRLDLNVSTL